MTQRNENGGSDERNGESQISRKSETLDFSAIEHAVNDAAKRVNAIWLALIFLMTYVLISTGKITHKDLFFETPVKLPIFGVDVPLRGYFVFVPAFILALHFYFSVQLSGLAEKFREYETILFEIEEIESRRERLRQRLDNSLFAKVLGGPRGRLRLLMRVVSWISMVIAPVWLMLFVQLTYLPAQDGLVTNWQRGFLAIDTLLAFLYVLPWILRRNNPFPQKLSSETNLAFGLRISADSGWPDSIASLIAVLGALWISLFVAIFPWERSPNAALAESWFGARADPLSRGPDKWFANRLVLSDQNLVEGADVATAKVTRSARNRNLVAAIFDRSDLRQVDFTGSNLSFASFKSANLQRANLGCAYTSYPSDHPEERSYGGCIQLREATLESADMRDASLAGAKMFGASLRSAQLNRAALQQTDLQGATLDSASLDAADLWAAGLDGASLKAASLIGASFQSARIRGADFSNATLFGASLDLSFAQNASFAGAQLQGASMSKAHFDGANFLAAAVYGTDVSNSSFEGARIKNILVTARWSMDWGYSLYSSVPKRDPFGKDGDDRDLGYNLGYYGGKQDPESLEYFADYSPISQTGIDSVVTQLFDGAPPNSPDAELKRRLSRLGADAVTGDWSNLVGKSATEAEYIEGLINRLLVIACAEAGGASVVRGLIKSQMLCPFVDNINLILRTSHRPDGPICENMAGLLVTLEQWSTCPQPKK